MEWNVFLCCALPSPARPSRLSSSEFFRFPGRPQLHASDFPPTCSHRHSLCLRPRPLRRHHIINSPSSAMAFIGFELIETICAYPSRRLYKALLELSMVVIIRPKVNFHYFFLLLFFFF